MTASGYDPGCPLPRPHGHHWNGLGRGRGAEYERECHGEPLPRDVNSSLTADEYEARHRRLEADAVDAKKALASARTTYDRICNDLRDLRTAGNEQQGRGEQKPEETT